LAGTTLATARQVRNTRDVTVIPNLPLIPGVPTEQKPWFKDLKDIFDRIEARSTARHDNFSGVVFTNFGWHYSRVKRVPGGGEYVIVTSHKPRFPVSPKTWQLLRRALDEYGFVPDEEQHEKEVRAKYPLTLNRPFGFLRTYSV
jgi:hypothetical protein